MMHGCVIRIMKQTSFLVTNRDLGVALDGDGGETGA